MVGLYLTNFRRSGSWQKFIYAFQQLLVLCKEHSVPLEIFSKIGCTLHDAFVSELVLLLANRKHINDTENQVTANILNLFHTNIKIQLKTLI